VHRSSVIGPKPNAVKDVNYMLIKLIKLLFSSNEVKDQTANSVDESIEMLNNISNGLGEFASFAFDDQNQNAKKEKARQMLSIITDIETKNALLNNTTLSYSLAIAYCNYNAWFVRGEERKMYLEKCISFLYKAISIYPKNHDAKSELGRLLIEEKEIRNLTKGIELLEELDREGKMPSFLNSVLSKAHRQSGNIEIDDMYELCEFTDPSPAVFREERKRFRALINKYKKQEEIEKLKITLNQYYNLAVLVTVCYGSHDCNSAVSGFQYDQATKIVKQICNKINCSFASHGYILNSKFISGNDLKTFIKVFGDIDKSYDPLKKL
jgi:hypothetical protein